MRLRRDVEGHVNRTTENLSGVAIRCGQDRPDEYGKTDGQDVKRGVITNTPIRGVAGIKPGRRKLVRDVGKLG